MPRIPLTQPENSEHVWLNAFACINPTSAFAEDVGRMVIEKVMTSKYGLGEDDLIPGGGHVVLLYVVAT